LMFLNFFRQCISNSAPDGSSGQHLTRDLEARPTCVLCRRGRRGQGRQNGLPLLECFASNKEFRNVIFITTNIYKTLDSAKISRRIS
jgi:hypothetical protein